MVRIFSGQGLREVVFGDQTFSFWLSFRNLDIPLTTFKTYKPWNQALFGTLLETMEIKEPWDEDALISHFFLGHYHLLLLTG